MRKITIIIPSLLFLLTVILLFPIIWDYFFVMDCTIKSKQISNSPSKKIFYDTIYRIDTSTIRRFDNSKSLLSNKEFLTIFKNPSVHMKDAIDLLEHEYAPIMREVTIRSMDNLSSDDYYIYLNRVSILFENGILTESELFNIMSPKFRDKKKNLVNNNYYACRNTAYARIILSSKSSLNLKYEVLLHRLNILNFGKLSLLDHEAS